DGIRDFHVTGVQTCALPILHYKQVIDRDHGANEVYYNYAVALRYLGDYEGSEKWAKLYKKQGGDAKLVRALKKDQSTYLPNQPRSEERRVGKECRSRCSLM